jgi:hypothetical protein
MKGQCITQGNCVHIDIHISERHETLLDVGRNKRKNYKFCLNENEN